MDKFDNDELLNEVKREEAKAIIKKNRDFFMSVGSTAFIACVFFVTAFSYTVVHQSNLNETSLMHEAMNLNKDKVKVTAQYALPEALQFIVK